MITRRSSLGFFARPRQQDWKPLSARDVIRERYFPNVLLRTQENRTVRLYDDLIKNKIILINFMFTNCDGICPLVTQNLARVQRLLGGRAGRDVFFCSFSLDPQHDTPSVLKAYADLHKAGSGWSFLTGTPGEMEMLRRRLGFVDPDPAVDADRESHIGNVRYGNEPRTLWGACPGMSSPQFIVDALGWV